MTLPLTPPPATFVPQTAPSAPFRFTDHGADLLREAVRRAAEEFNNNPTSTDGTAGGAWDQSEWFRVPVDLQDSWETWVSKDDRVYRVAATNPLDACGTTGCLAGHLATLAGYWPAALWMGNREQRGESIGRVLTPTGIETVPVAAVAAVSPNPNPNPYPFIHYTCPIPLSNDKSWIHSVFQGDNTLTEVVRIADRALEADGRESTGVDPGNQITRYTCDCLMS